MGLQEKRFKKGDKLKAEDLEAMRQAVVKVMHVAPPLQMSNTAAGLFISNTGVPGTSVHFVRMHETSIGGWSGDTTADLLREDLSDTSNDVLVKSAVLNGVVLEDYLCTAAEMDGDYYLIGQGATAGRFDGTNLEVYDPIYAGTWADTNIDLSYAAVDPAWLGSIAGNPDWVYAQWTRGGWVATGVEPFIITGTWTSTGGSGGTIDSTYVGTLLCPSLDIATGTTVLAIWNGIFGRYFVIGHCCL